MNLRKKLLFYISFSLVFLILSIGFGVIIYLNKNLHSLIIGLFGLIIGVCGTGIFSLLSMKKYMYKNSITKNSFNHFVDEIINYNSIGTIIYDTDFVILWTSLFIQNRFGKNLIGTTLNEFFELIGIKFDIKKSNISFKYEKSNYILDIWPLKNCISIRDNSIEQNMLDIYNSESAVIGEIEIDNYNLYRSILSEEELYNVNKHFIALLDNLVANYNFVYRQYTNGKFLIFTNAESINKMKELNFNFFAKLHNALKETAQSNFIMSCSAGFAVGFSSLTEKMEQAKAALLQAQSRGGDQVTIVSNTDRPRYFGSSSEILYDISRTRIANIANVIETKLKDPKIKKVLIYGHTKADLDALGSALGIWSLAKQFGKEAYICSTTQDNTTKKAIDKLIPKNNEIIIRTQQANKFTDKNTLVFLVDNSDIKRTDNPDCISGANVNNIFILDHHRLGTNIDFCPKTNRYIDSAASSASEIVCEIIMFIKKHIKLETFVVQMLLNGIYLDTLQFTKHVNARTFIAAGWLEERGADSAKSSEILKIDEQTQLKINEVLQNIQEIKPGYFLAYKDIPLSNDVISIAAEEILKISDRKAAFVVARLENEKVYKLSARSFNVNVQLIAEEVGGGGHFGTAAATSNENFETFIDNIKQAIVSVRDESNFD
ncbi:DHH family phosphoesterase [Mycoplasmopsis felifaucium]|uniref:DHH family phosphoesterase n=1 Tax=Mycoplasmopsis felifaucium TaxID=35768 RepID=A0ABZ2RRT7_9BACT